jgi:hypothetical protein
VIRRRLPFPMLGLDTDNDTVFMKETVRDYRAAEKIELTRCRPYRKNDQAHVERKNGEFVRRMVGYLTFISTDDKLRQLIFWTLGSLGPGRRRLIELARKRGFSEVKLHVTTTQQAAINLYRSIGFQPVKREVFETEVFGKAASFDTLHMHSSLADHGLFQVA